MTINVFNIQHFSVGDGPGIRTTVFLPGCCLRCPWCHNPESLYGKGKEYNINDVVSDVMADNEFYVQSSGGVTISGGEPLCSGDTCLALLRLFKMNGLHTAVDTSLSFVPEELDEIAKLTDLFLADLKTADPDKFREICRGDLSVVLSTIEHLKDIGANIVLRIPLIPGFNTDSDQLDGIIKIVERFDLPVTLLPFHRLGTPKYKELGIPYEYENTEPLSNEELKKIRARFTEAGIKEAKV